MDNNGPQLPWPSVPALLRQIRGGRTQEAFADELKVRRTDYNAWENGRRGLSRERAEMFAAMSAYPVEAFLKGPERDKAQHIAWLQSLSDGLEEMKQLVLERVPPDEEDLLGRLEWAQRALAAIVEAEEPPAPAQERSKQ